MTRRCKWEKLGDCKICDRCGLIVCDDDKPRDKEFCGDDFAVRCLLWLAWTIIVVASVMTAMGIIFRAD